MQWQYVLLTTIQMLPLGCGDIGSSDEAMTETAAADLSVTASRLVGVYSESSGVFRNLYLLGSQEFAADICEGAITDDDHFGYSCQGPMAPLVHVTGTYTFTANSI